MDLSLEAYRIIVENVRHRSDLATLCRVSKAFQQVAERALYNTVFMHDVDATMSFCTALSLQPRVAGHVEAFTISLFEPSSTTSDEDEDHDDPDDDEESYETADEDDIDLTSHRDLPPICTDDLEPRDSLLPEQYWQLVASALQNTRNLRYLNIHISSPFNAAVSWILTGCTFHLRGFHCDLGWDGKLVQFLNAQEDIEDLYLEDFKDFIAELLPPEQTHSPQTSEFSSTPHPQPPESPITAADQASPDHESSEGSADHHSLLSLDPTSLPRLRTLECTFTEAANHIVPYRPVAHLKTCLSKSTISEKRIELLTFIERIRFGTGPGLLSLDLADSEYSEDFSIELLEMLTQRDSPSALQYLGTLVLPVGGRQRLVFYALLMRFPRLRCVELEVSHWQPMPDSFQAFRALAGELRLYCPKISIMIFVHDFERSVVRYLDGGYILDETAAPDLFWREDDLG